MMMNSPPKRPDPLDLRQQRIMARSGALRTNHEQIPPSAFVAKRQVLLDELASGKFLKEKEEEGAKAGGATGSDGKADEPEMPPNPLGDKGAMDGMMDQMKKSMIMMIPQQLIMGWIAFFFSGFVVAKVPLPLPFPLDYFQGYMQRGLLSQGIQIGWVSSISWYFLVAFFGLNAVYRILLGDDNGEWAGERAQASKEEQMDARTDSQSHDPNHSIAASPSFSSSHFSPPLLHTSLYPFSTHHSPFLYSLNHPRITQPPTHTHTQTPPLTAADSTRDMMGPLGGGGAAPQAPNASPFGKADFSKLHLTERDTLDRVGKELLEAPPPVDSNVQAGKGLTGFGGKKAGKGGKRWVGDGVEVRVLRRYGNGNVLL